MVVATGKDCETNDVAKRHNYHFLFGDIMADNPFSMGYVLKTTARHMRKSIDISIRKTFDRLPEFVQAPDKSTEIFKTLAMLHTLRKQLDDFQAMNAEDFRKTN